MRDADGYFAVLGRSDDVLNVAGHRIGTADVEGSLHPPPGRGRERRGGPARSHQGRAHQGVRGAAGPASPTGPGLIASLKDHVRQDLGGIAMPSEIEIRASLPKTRSGKIVRRYLKAEALGQDPGDLSTLAD